MARDRFPIIVHTFLLRADSVLLLRRVSTGFADGMYGLPGGHLHAGERIASAAVRECREETGVEIELENLLPVCVMPYITETGQGVDFIFRCERFVGEPRIGEPERCDDLRWCELSALPSNTVGFVRVAAAHLDDARARDDWLVEHGWPDSV
jgi:ADP-ribose pyrophosphatase YjhB (NUDIX family)